MNTTRLEAFSDGVIAILITIMVLELKVPDGADWKALASLTPVLLTYLLSFVFLGIYWNNHHHLLRAAERISGGAMWANLHLLFWLSLVPFGTWWMGKNHIAPLPTAVYGVIMLGAAIAYTILSALLISEPANDKLREAVRKSSKGLLSNLLYAAAIPLAFVSSWIAIAIYVSVALMWLVPDRQIETKIKDADAGRTSTAADA